MTIDETEEIRSQLIVETNSVKGDREILEKKHGQVWDTKEVRNDFDLTGFQAPFVLAYRKSDNVRGTLLYQHRPRFYFGFQRG